MSFKTETLAGAFAQKVKPELGRVKSLEHKTNLKKEARPTQYPTSAGQWDSDEFGLV